MKSKKDYPQETNIYCGITGKEGYTKEEIEYVIDRILREDNKRLRSYRCPFCGWFHLTSK